MAGPKKNIRQKRTYIPPRSPKYHSERERPLHHLTKHHLLSSVAPHLSDLSDFPRPRQRTPPHPPGTEHATDISDEHRSLFDQLAAGIDGESCLFSCFVDGPPAASICTLNVEQSQAPADRDTLAITPSFISVTPRMDIAIDATAERDAPTDRS